jgi:uncharacterized protein (TIGR01244 family)
MSFRIIAAMATFAMLVVPHAQPGDQAVTQVAKPEVRGIENFSQIRETTGFAGTQIGFGGATQASAMASLKRRGFVTVINLRLADEENNDLQGGAAAARSAGLNYIHLPFDKDATAPQLVEDFLAMVGDQANQPVYVHCSSATRAAALWMIGRVLVDGWDIDAASAEAGRIADRPPEAVAFATAYIRSSGE